MTQSAQSHNLLLGLTVVVVVACRGGGGGGRLLCTKQIVAPSRQWVITGLQRQAVIRHLGLSLGHLSSVASVINGELIN